MWCTFPRSIREFKPDNKQIKYLQQLSFSYTLLIFVNAIATASFNFFIILK